MRALPEPLYTDPVHLAPTDPTLVEGPDGSWWMFYTQRRAHDLGPGVRWIHGTDIGVATSTDGGASWNYAGIVAGLDPGRGRNTLWAPEVIFAEGRFHMFVSYIEGVPSRWTGDRHVLHHVSDDLLTWTYHGVVPLSSNRVIDAAVHELPGGGYQMWFKDEAHECETWATDSADLSTWGPSFPVITGPGHEGPNVFALGDAYWMVVDEWRGLAVHRSTDLDRWERQGLILDRPGVRTRDQTFGRHADVVIGRDAHGGPVGWIFYFTHWLDGVDDEDAAPPSRVDAAIERHRTDVQVAELQVVGGRLRCDRDAPVDLDLRRATRYAAFPGADPTPGVRSLI